MNVVVAYPVLLVTAVSGVTRPVEKENVTVSLGSPAPFRVTLAVILDVMLEFAATVEGFDVNVNVPGAIVTFVDFDSPAHVTVTVAVPRVVSG